MRTAISNDLSSSRLYYERLCPADSHGAGSFVELLEKEGNLQELDSWLAQRAPTNDEWLSQRIWLGKKLGTANELIDALASDLKAHPADSTRLERYLRFAPYVSQDVAWVADVFEMKLAFEYFKLGSRLVNNAPAAANYIEFNQTPFCGVQQDGIYGPAAVDATAGTHKPNMIALSNQLGHKDDTFLLPVVEGGQFP